MTEADREQTKYCDGDGNIPFGIDSFARFDKWYWIGPDSRPHRMHNEESEMMQPAPQHECTIQKHPQNTCKSSL